MKRLSLTVKPSDGFLYHPTDEIHQESEIKRELLLHVNLLSDGTITALYRMRGDIEKLRDYYESSQDVLDYNFFAVGDNVYHVYVHVSEGDPATGLLEMAEENNLIIDTPMECTGDGGITLTVYGESETLRNTVREIPEGLSIDVEKMGDYDPSEDTKGIASGLTRRQREVLRLAVEEGYYDVPRRTNSEELAEELDCAPSTVSEHLRKIEAEILSSVV